MAESIVKLKIDSQEWDSKLKNADNGLTRFFEHLKQSGQSVKSADDNTLKYVQALGQMETKATSARGKISEMSKAFIDLSVQYRQLSQEERNTPFGQALGKSLDQLKTRVVDAKKEMNEIGQSIGNIPTGTKAVGGAGVLTGLNDIISASQGGITGLLGTLGRFGPQAAAIGGIGAAIVGIGSSAIEARQSIENLELNIGTLLGSAEKGKQLVAELQEYGQATPYDTEGLAGAARTMLAYGVNAQQVMPIMKELGDVAQGNTQNLQSLALAFGQMTAVGTVQKQDLNQMANAGFGFNQIAKSMGVTVAEFLDMVSKKKVSVDDIAKALHDATSEGGLFYKSAENASAGLEGTFSNFEESLTSTKAKLGELIEPAVIEVVKSLGDGIEGLTTSLGGSSEAGETFKAIGEGLGIMIKALFERFGEVVEAGKAVGKIISELGEIFSPVTDAIGDMVNAVFNLQTGFDSGDSSILVKAVRALFNPLSTLISQLNTAAEAITAARHKLIGDSADEFIKKHPGADKAPKPRPAKAGDKIDPNYFADADTYKNERYGSVDGNGNWIFNDRGAKVWNQNHPNVQPKAASKSNNKGGGNNNNKKNNKKNKNLTRSEITKKINELDDEYANASPTRRNEIQKEINRLRSQKKQLDQVAGVGTSKTRKRTTTKRTPKVKTEEEKNNDSIKKLEAEFYSPKTTDSRKTAIQSEIKSLQDRNLQIQRAKDLAKGISPDSVKGLNNEISRLKSQQDMSRTNKEWDEWQDKIDKTKDKLNAIQGIKPGSIQALNNEISDLTNQQNLSTTNEEWQNMQDQIDGVTKKINAIKGISEGSLPALKQELQDLQNKQGMSKTHEDWVKWGQQIDEVQKKIDKITQKDFSSLTTSNISGFISDMQQQLGQATVGGLDYSTILDKESFATAFQNLLKEGLQDGADFTDIDAAGLWQKILTGDDPEGVKTALSYMLGQVNDARGFKGLGKMSVDNQGGLQEQDNSDEQEGIKGITDKADKMLGAMSQLTGGLQSMGIKIPDGVTKIINFGQGLIQVIQAVQTLISIFSTSTAAMQITATTANTAALAANTMALATNSVTGLIPFARGGVVHAATGHIFGGNHFSGDLIPAAVNSGELILNRAQQGNVASQLEGMGSLNNLELSTEVNGENLRFVLNANGRRTGRGEMVTSNIKLW